MIARGRGAAKWGARKMRMCEKDEKAKKKKKKVIRNFGGRNGENFPEIPAKGGNFGAVAPGGISA